MSEYTQEMRQLDAKIATVVGWRNVNDDGLGDPPHRDFEYLILVPFYQDDPRTGTGEAAKAELLHWLALDDERWRKFSDALFDLLNLWPEDADQIKGALLATPAQVAEAACKALGIK